MSRALVLNIPMAVCWPCICFEFVVAYDYTTQQGGTLAPVGVVH